MFICAFVVFSIQVVVKTMKVERDKAVQDCKAAVERSQALAAEVIALEEKVGIFKGGLEASFSRPFWTPS